MDEAAQAAQAEQAAAEQKLAEDAKLLADPAEMARKIAALNQENAQRRINETKLAEKLAAREAKEREAEEKAALERGEHLGMYEKAKAQNETYEQQLAAKDAALQKFFDAELAQIPEDKRVLLDHITGVEAKLEFIAVLKATKVFNATVPGPGVKEPGTHEKGTLEAELAAAKESGNVQAQISIKKRIFDRDHH